MGIKFILILIFLLLAILGLVFTITDYEGIALFIALIWLSVGILAVISLFRNYKKHTLAKAINLDKPFNQKVKPQYVYSDDEVLSYEKSPTTTETGKRQATLGKVSYDYAYDPLFSDFVVIDFETTGLSPTNDKIIQIGAVKVANCTVIDTFNSYVNPRLSIPMMITRINGITDQMVKGAPYIEQIMPVFINFIGDLPIVAHNASFDVGFLKANTNAELDLTVADTLRFCRRYYPDFENHKLDTICCNLNIKLEGHHQALNDCMATTEVYLTCREQYQIENRVNFAKEAEKNGDLEEAIRLYELMIENNFEGNFPYDRLAIIYRKKKDYANEIRVISHAIWVLENVVHQNRADRETKLTKFNERLEKAKKLMDKHAPAVEV